MKPDLKNNDMQSKEVAMQSSVKKKHVPLYKDKKCQENQNINMRPVKPEIN